MRYSAVLLLGLAAGFATTSALAETRFAKVCIKNTTTSQMRFNWRFGTKAKWQTVHLSPRQQEIFSLKLAQVNVNNSPPLYVTYDAEKKGKDIEPKVLAVNYTAGNSTCNQAKLHEFRTDPKDANFITLYVLN